ncbi:unnamed protein product, partial [Effrenium voratum]
LQSSVHFRPRSRRPCQPRALRQMEEFEDELERYLDAAPASLWPDSEAGSDAAAEAPSISPWPWSRLREETPPGEKRRHLRKAPGACCLRIQLRASRPGRCRSCCRPE